MHVSPFPSDSDKLNRDNFTVNKKVIWKTTRSFQLLKHIKHHPLNHCPCFWMPYTSAAHFCTEVFSKDKHAKSLMKIYVILENTQLDGSVVGFLTPQWHLTLDTAHPLDSRAPPLTRMYNWMPTQEQRVKQTSTLLYLN